MKIYSSILLPFVAALAAAFAPPFLPSIWQGNSLNPPPLWGTARHIKERKPMRIQQDSDQIPPGTFHVS
jgi:hypothetical protein